MQNFSEFLEQLIIDHGSQLNVAAEARIEPAKLSRFRSDQSGLTRVEIDSLLEVGRAFVTAQREIRQYQEAIDLLTTLWRRERKMGKEATQ